MPSCVLTDDQKYDKWLNTKQNPLNRVSQLRLKFRERGLSPQNSFPGFSRFDKKSYLLNICDLLQKATADEEF
jgi:hypothetical protein